MRKVAKTELEILVKSLNDMQGFSHSPINPDKTYNVGTYVIDWAYGTSCKLVQITNNTGGERDVFSFGYMSKTSLYALIHAYAQGIREERERVKLLLRVLH